MYYIYAGYYELHLSKHKLEEPFVKWGEYASFEEMIEASDRLDGDASKIFYKDVVDEAMLYYGISDSSILTVA